MDYANLDDATLLRLIAYHKSEALSEFYDRYVRLVFSVALNSLGEHALAEEISQDVFTRVWEKAYTYDAGMGKASTWLINITRHRAIDELRRQAVRPEQRSVVWDDVSPRETPVVDGPEGILELDWQQKIVREAIHALPKEQQEALALAYFKGYSHSQIALALGEPLGTVKTRIRLAMQKLRQLLSEQVLDGG